MKTCKCCKVEKPIDEFRKNRKTCIECDNQSWVIIRKEKRELLWKIKDKLSCVICGEKDSICLDFHHKIGTEKKFKIAKADHKAWSVIMEELEKCVVLCSNCHRKLHYYIDNNSDHELIERVKNIPAINRKNFRTISKKKWWKDLTKPE